MVDFGIDERFEVSDGWVTRKLKAGDESGNTLLPAALDVADASEAWYAALREGKKPRYLTADQAPLRVLDLFSGAGGLALGVLDGLRGMGRRASVCAALDVDGDALEIYARNLAPETTRCGDVAAAIDFQVEGSAETARFAYPPQVVDPRLAARLVGVGVIVAGPPCQGHSNLNNHTRRADARNRLYLAVPAFAVATGAHTVIIENVPEVVRDRSGVVASTIKLLMDAGYSVVDGVLDASRYGWPQRRRRYFLVATRFSDVARGSLVDMLRPLERPAKNLRWCIGDLAGRTGQLPLHVPAALSAENNRRIAWLFDNDAYDLQDSERPVCHQQGTSYVSVYGRLRWDEPCFTVTTGFLTPGRGRYVHPSEPRTLTAKEAARIQGFPDWFDFRLSNGEQPNNKLATKVIGDAVPPILGRLAVLAALAQRSATSARPPETTLDGREPCVADVASASPLPSPSPKVRTPKARSVDSRAA